MIGKVLRIVVVLLVALCFAVACNADQKGKKSAGGQAREFTNSIGMGFALIPAGSFMMGCNKDFEECNNDQTPQHRVTITKPFYMGKYEVTQEQWTKIMGSNPSEFKGRSNPVEKVSWDDAQDFIERLSKKNGNTYRLPTEAEWEYAARAGSESAYSFGDAEEQLGQYAWYYGNSGNKTHSAGQLKPNAWGLYDMHGNVWEWCQDWYDESYYGNSPLSDPQGPSSGKYRVLRGGSWGDSAGYVRAANRFDNPPGYRGDVNGFRVVRSAR